MDAAWLIAIFLICVVWPMGRHYEPGIDIVPLRECYKVYLWYNKWDGSYYMGRACRYLFKISKSKRD